MFLLMLSELGPGSLAAFLGAIALAFLGFLRNRREGCGSAWFCAAAGATVAFIVGGVFNALLVAGAHAAYAWMAMGLLAGWGKEDVRVGGLRCAAGVSAGAALIIFFGAAAVLHIRAIGGRYWEYAFQTDGGRHPAYMEKALALDPWDSDRRIHAGSFYLEEKDYSRAEREFSSVLEVEPGHPYACYKLGEVHRARGDDAGALRWYGESVRRAPLWALPRWGRAEAHMGRGRFAEAEKELAELIALAPKLAQARFQHGLALALLREYKRAAERFREARGMEWDVKGSLAQRTDPWLRRAEIEEFLR
jgi:tetratricopeptide (TPR) repeat protein